MIDFRNCDCMELMAGYEDNYFDLAIVDPPYGIGAHKTIGFADKKTKGFTFDKKEYKNKGWDNNIPTVEYFSELKRISNNQIIWGANYFSKNLGEIKNFIYWHKKGQSEDSKFNEGELAYTSIGRRRMGDIWWNGFGVINSKEHRFHPTQKPVKLYTWLLSNYAKQGDKILDTHVGSASSLIACHQLGFDVVGCELDKEYYELAQKRIKEETSQLSLF